MPAAWTSATIINTFSSNNTQSPNWGVWLVRRRRRWDCFGHASLFSVDINLRLADYYTIYDLATFSRESRRRRASCSSRRRV